MDLRSNTDGGLTLDHPYNRAGPREPSRHPPEIQAPGLTYKFSVDKVRTWWARSNPDDGQEATTKVLNLSRAVYFSPGSFEAGGEGFPYLSIKV